MFVQTTEARTCAKMIKLRHKNGLRNKNVSGVLHMKSALIATNIFECPMNPGFENNRIARYRRNLSCDCLLGKLMKPTKKESLNAFM